MLQGCEKRSVALFVLYLGIHTDWLDEVLNNTHISFSTREVQRHLSLSLFRIIQKLLYWLIIGQYWFRFTLNSFLQIE